MRIKGVLPRQEAHTHRQLLTTSQECLLEHYIKSMSVQGFPITYKHLTDRAAAFYRANQNQNVDDSDLDVSRRWHRGFLYRHPAVQSCFSRSIDHARAKVSNKTVIDAHYDLLKRTIEDNAISLHKTYNMDVTGFVFGKAQSQKVLFTRQTRKARHSRLNQTNEKVLRLLSVLVARPYLLR